MSLLLILHTLATSLMAGLCWCVQVVHYPLMTSVPEGEAFRSFAREHARRITWFVAPTMLIEAATTLLLTLQWRDVSAALRPLLMGNVASLALLWAITFGIMVPLHTRLQHTGAHAPVTHLVRWNWVRTLLWSAKAVLATIILARA